MTDTERRSAAARFAADWKGRGDEKQETQAFWLTLLQKIYGIEEPEKYISFELPVKLDHTSFIDGYISDTRVLIEQKGQDVDLRKGYKQSDGSMLTPFGQARRYAGYLPFNQVPRWIIVCNSWLTLAASISKKKWKSPSRLASWWGYSTMPS